jgi:hypothetical protein
MNSGLASRPTLPGPLSKTRRTDITVIRFSRHLARQCAAVGSRLPDRIVCDTIANGSRFATGRRGPGAGAVFRFERTFGPGLTGVGRPGAGPTVRVLAEVAGGGCVALRLLPGSGLGKKLGIFGIFESRRFKMNASTRVPL